MANYCERLTEAAGRFPDRVAIEMMSEAGLLTMTYRALADRAATCAAALAARGVQRGDRVAILADNGAAWIAAYFGILRLAAVAVPLDTAYRAPQISAVVSSCRPRVVLTTPRYEAYAREGASGAGGDAPAVVGLEDLGPGPSALGPRTNTSATSGPGPSALGPGDAPPIAEAAAGDPAVHPLHVRHDDRSRRASC